MITHKEIPGGGGGECRTDGRYVSNRRDGSALVITGDGRIDCPPGSNVLYPRVTPVGEFKIVGQCSPDNCMSTYEWQAGIGWTDVGWSVGVSAAIYDYEGRLWTVSPGGQLNTSQGFRYVEPPTATRPAGKVILGDATMSAAPDGILLHEYTVFAGGYHGGQGHEEGTHIVTPDKQRFVLQHGDNRFTRWTYDPARDVLAVAISNLSRQSVEFWWMELADILTLEPYEDIPEEPVKLPRPVWDRLNAVRAPLGDMNTKFTDDERGRIFNDTAKAFPKTGPGAVGMQRKDSGTAATLPDGTRVWNGLRWIDDAGAHWGFDVCGACSAGYMRPVDAEGGAADAGSFVEWQGIDPPPGNLEARVAALEARVERHLKP
ncbi:MAG TPA: hypothetical protein VK467_04530 [Gemmatimonadales bacterium]|nr:hypothetical protein [Gemmatimonadales bacterium]